MKKTESNVKKKSIKRNFRNDFTQIIPHKYINLKNNIFFTQYQIISDMIPENLKK